MITQPIDHEHRLTEPAAMLTAAEAFALVWARVELYDPNARLVLVKSDISINAQGRANAWRFEFDFPDAYAWGSFEVRRQGSPSRNTPETVYLTEHLRPFVPVDSPVWQPLLQSNPIHERIAGRTPDERAARLRTQQWQQRLAQRPALPVPFRDSSEVVQVFTEQGVDFDAGPADMHLESAWQAPDQAIWRVIVGFDAEGSTLFAVPERS